MKKIIIFTDGGARGNPGPAGIGATIADENGKVLKEISEYIGEQTNNFAEYEALIRALQETKKLLLVGPTRSNTSDVVIEVYMDSELVVRQLNGQYKVKEPMLKEKFAQVATMRLEDFPNLTFNHVRREKNSHADKLVNQAIDKAEK